MSNTTMDLNRVPKKGLKNNVCMYVERG